MRNCSLCKRDYLPSRTSLHAADYGYGVCCGKCFNVSRFSSSFDGCLAVFTKEEIEKWV